MRLLFPLLLALVVLAGCDSAEDPVSTTLLPDHARYAWSLMSVDVDADSLVFGEGAEVGVRTVSRNASVPGYGGLTELETRRGESRSWTWYEPAATRLREVAYRGAGMTPAAEPRSAPGVRLEGADVFGLPQLVAELAEAYRAARGGSADSLIVRDDPRVVFELPLEIGASWVSFTDPFRSTREVVGREVVAVEAGTFECFVIRTEVDLRREEGESFEWFDYVSEEHGLVLRTLDVVSEYRGPDNQPTGAFTRSVERLELTAGS
jgi:hypothetical protein